MKVKAVRNGYYDHKRRRPGAVFEMRDVDYSPKDEKGKPIFLSDGSPAVCSWVEPYNGKMMISDAVKPSQRPKKKQEPEIEETDDYEVSGKKYDDEEESDQVI